jgi:hypothetical protein
VINSIEQADLPAFLISICYNVYANKCMDETGEYAYGLSYKASEL